MANNPLGFTDPSGNDGVINILGPLSQGAAAFGDTISDSPLLHILFGGESSSISGFIRSFTPGAKHILPCSTSYKVGQGFGIAFMLFAGAADGIQTALDSRGAASLLEGEGATLLEGQGIPPDETALLRGHLDDALAQLEEQGLTKGQQKAIVENPRLEATFRGERIDTFFKESVSQDANLRHLEITPRFRFGPDVYDQATERWWDVTTAGQWSKHVAKYGEQFGLGTPLLYR